LATIQRIHQNVLEVHESTDAKWHKDITVSALLPVVQLTRAS